MIRTRRVEIILGPGREHGAGEGLIVRGEEVVAGLEEILVGGLHGERCHVDLTKPAALDVSPAGRGDGRQQSHREETREKEGKRRSLEGGTGAAVGDGGCEADQTRVGEKGPTRPSPVGRSTIGTHSSGW